MRSRTTINKLTLILLRITTSLLLIGGMLSVVKGCSSEWSGQEGASAIGAALLSVDFIFYGIFLFMLSGWAIALYKMSTARKKAMSNLAALASAVTGLLLLSSSRFLNYNPFTESNSGTLHLFPSKLIGFLSAIVFLLIGVNYFTVRMTNFRQSRRDESNL
jgi:hypothetical protein